MLPKAHPAPVADHERIGDIDVLRGLALCGVAVSNLLEVFRIPWGAKHYEVPNSGKVDALVDAIMAVAFTGNTITSVFAMLFGIGMAISFEHVLAAGISGYRLLIRRQIVLLFIGVLHATLIWNGDILTNYAAAGLLALPVLGRSKRVPLIVAGVMAVILSLQLIPRRVMPNANTPHALAETLRIYGSGNWTEILAHRLGELPYIWNNVTLRFLPATVTSFCLGIAIWQSALFREPEKHLRVLRWMASIGLLSLGYNLVDRLSNIPHELPFVFRVPMRLLYTVVFLQLALAYGAGILLLLRVHLWRRWLLKIAPLGQMALSNYIMQSMVFGFVFYGYGLGQFGKQRSAVTAAFGLLFFLLQAVVSTVWLRHFRFGPIEWLWRTLSYGKRQPFRREPQ